MSNPTQLESLLRYLSAFVAVAEELHFTRAAQRQHLSQQTLSVQIGNLESALGVKLFVRTTRRVELTDAGHKLLGHAAPLLAAAGRAWDDVRSSDRREERQLFLSYAPTVAQAMLPALLGEFAQRHAGVTVNSCAEWWDDAPMIEKGSVEVTITRAAPSTPEIVSTAIAQTPLGVMIGQDHPLARGSRLSLGDLHEEALKIWPRALAPRFYDEILTAMRAASFTGPVEPLVISGTWQLQDDPAACREIVAGRAVGFGFEHQYTLLEPEIVWRRVEPTIQIPMFLCWRRDANAAAHAFVEVALDVAHARGWANERDD